MDYATARSIIEDGDLIGVHGEHGLLVWPTRFFTRSKVTHVGIAVWLDGGLYLAELNGGGNHYVPLSQLSEVGFEVRYPPVNDRSRVKQAVQDLMRSKKTYGYLGLAVVGLITWLKIKVSIRAKELIVCSGWCRTVYEAAGAPRKTQMVSPGDLCNELPLKLTVETPST